MKNSSSSRLKSIVIKYSDQKSRIDDVESFVLDLERDRKRKDDEIKKALFNRSSRLNETPPSKETVNIHSQQLMQKQNEIKNRFDLAFLKIQQIQSSLRSFNQIASSLQNKRVDISTPKTRKINSASHLFPKRIKKLENTIESLDNIYNQLKLSEKQLDHKSKEIDVRFKKAKLLMQEPITDLKALENKYRNIKEEINNLESMHVSHSVDNSKYSNELEELESRNGIRRKVLSQRKEELQNSKIKIEKQEIKIRSILKQQKVKAQEIEDAQNEFHQRIIYAKEKQDKLDQMTIETDKQIEENNRQRIEIESKYDKKLEKISSLTKQTNEIEKLFLNIHEMHEQIAADHDKLAQLEGIKHEKQRSQAISKSINQEMEFQKQKLAILCKSYESKKESYNQKAHLLSKKKIALTDMMEKFKASFSEYEKREIEVNQMEKQTSEYENKVDELNDIIKKESEQIDQVLFQASTIRADSRIQRLQEILESRTESQFDFSNTLNKDNDSDGEFSELLQQAALVLQMPSKSQSLFNDST